MLKFIDLFCGIGGFHQGICKVANTLHLETRCLFAADKDVFAANIYTKNYNIDANYDLKEEATHELIDKIINENINSDESLDFVFGGFPCQTFSKAGNQEGFENKIKGTLFFEIVNIVKRHNPKYLLLENVRNLRTHDNCNTWKTIRAELESLNYIVDYVIISPNQIPNKNIPALRDRIFIICYRNDIEINFNFLFNGKRLLRQKTSIYDNFKSETLSDKYFCQDLLHNVEKSRIETLDMWNEFRNRIIKNDGKMISPIWPHYFNDKNISVEPLWKQKIINRNRNFYKNNKNVIDQWLTDYNEHFNSLNASDRKFEWNAGLETLSIYDGIIQFRPSGVRVKKTDYFPTLVAINQKPIIGSQRRYITPEEIANLYGFVDLDLSGQSEIQSYKQLGNTVSVDVVEYLINHMLMTSNYGGGE